MTECRRYIDLFCGIGSFHYSFRKLGWECVMACDIDQDARATYQKNYGLEAQGDIININPQDIPHYDILCAGFPCQAFSVCGKHKGFQDERGNVFFQILKFVKCHKPTIIILENVPSLLTHNKGDTFRTIQGHLRSLDYTVAHKVLCCSDYGVPQMRKRVFIIGVRNDTAKQTKTDQLDLLLETEEYKKHTSLSTYLKRNFSREFAYTIRCGGRLSLMNDRHNWDGYIVDDKEYRLTFEECLKLQGFSASFEVCGTAKQKWKQIGNTIPTILTEMVGRNIQKFMG